MNTKKVLFVLATIIIVGGGTIYGIQSQTKDMMKANDKADAERLDERITTEMNNEDVNKDGMMEDKVMDEVKEDDMMDKKDDMMSKGSYEAYGAEKIAMAETGDVVIFFHASWCPSCRSLNASIEGSMAEIPEGVTILKTDYDKETELKKKYGVTTQHTLVQVDKDGNLIKKWSGSPDLAAIVSQIQ